MHKIYEYLCDELKDIEKKVESGQTLSMNELEYADKLVDMKKNLLKIETLEGDSEYSHTTRDYSYARGRNAKRDAMGRYSRERGYSRADDNFMHELRELMEEAPDEHKRQKVQRLINEMEQM